MAASRSGEEGAFAGLRVVDASQGVAGPHCGTLLALNGADVVKVEPPEGDWGRAIGRRHGDFSAHAIAFNRGKRSIALDFKSSAGLEAARRLMAGADVVVENYRPGVLARFGLDYASVAGENRDVVYASITGFGPGGPRAAYPATDSILQAYSGLMSVNRDGRGMPQRIGVLVIDVVTGLYAFQAVATALYRRATRGGGRHIELSLMDAVGAVQAGKMIEFHLEGPQAEKPGVPVATFPTADGYLLVNARRDKHFAALAEALGRPELARDARYATAAARAEHEAPLLAELEALVALWPTERLAAELAARDVLHAPVNDYAAYFADAHVRAAEAVRWLEHPEVGSIPFPRVPGYPHPEPGAAPARAPALGEHTGAVLGELGYGKETIEAMVLSGAAGALTAAD